MQSCGDGALRLRRRGDATRSVLGVRRRGVARRAGGTHRWRALLSVAKRLVIEVPFLLFAVLLPILGRKPRVDVLWFSLSEAGLWAAWNIVIKGTIGVAATVVLASTTSIPQLLDGLERLRVQRVMVGITAFMIRYADVLGDEVRRMNIARQSRGGGGGRFGQVRALASTAGTLFVRLVPER